MGRRKRVETMKSGTNKVNAIIKANRATVVVPGDRKVNNVDSAKNCYLCSEAINGVRDIAVRGSASADSRIDVFINALCEICELPIESVLEAANNGEATILNLNRVVFCDSCQFNFHKFRDIKSQLEVLKQELYHVKILISTTFLSNPLQKVEGSSSSFNVDADIFSEVSPEAITGHLEVEFGEDDTNDEMLVELEPTVLDAEDVNSRDPDYNPFPSYVPKDERRISTGNQKSTDILRSLKGRLKALLKRQKSKRVKKILPSSKTDRSNRKNLRQGVSLYKFPCPSCPRKLATEEMLRYHTRKNHEEHPTPYDCAKCDSQFERLGELRRHVRRSKACQSTESSQPVSSNSGTDCKDKGMETTGSASDPNPSVTETITCNDCGVVYRSQVGFDSHLKRQGGQCTRGPQPPKSEWKGPLNSRYDKTEKMIHRYICGACGKKYRSPHHLGIHIRAVHTDGFAFLCEYCCKPFNSKEALKGHQRVMHLEEFLASRSDTVGELERIRNLTCSFCQMMFASYDSKRKHEARHTNNIQFYCEVCGSGWATMSQLKTHVKNHGEKKYKCQICDHTSDRSTKRDRHMRAKHGLGDKSKNVQCQFCDKRFFESTHLKRHTLLLHPNETDIPPGFSCDLCTYHCAIREYIVIHSKTNKHMQKVEALGFTDPFTGIRFPTPKGLVRRNNTKSVEISFEAQNLTEAKLEL